MKHTLLPALLLLSMLGCSKFESEYAINCSFTADFFRERTVLVSNYKGDVIGEFHPAPGTNSFSVSLPVTDPDAPEYYDLHLIDTSGCSVYIYSHLAVPNGAQVFLNASTLEGVYSYDTYSQLWIEGIQVLDSMNLSDPLNQYSYHSPTEQIVRVGVLRSKNQGVLLRMRANGETGFRTLHIPSTAIGDTINRLSWQDFAPEENPVTIELPDDQKIVHLEVDAVTTDFKYHTKIKFDNAANTDIKPSFTPLPGNFAYRVRINRWNDNMEKIFMPGEPLRFEASDFSIREASINGKTVRVETEGDVDLLRLEFFNLREPQIFQYCITHWQISGSPAAFKNRELPNIDAWLPAELNKTAFFKNASITACQFGGHNYQPIREGFPWKSTEPFAFARSGYRAIRKDL
jgi:hypothetical protein